MSRRRFLGFLAAETVGVLGVAAVAQQAQTPAGPANQAPTYFDKSGMVPDQLAAAAREAQAKVARLEADLLASVTDPNLVVKASVFDGKLIFTDPSTADYGTSVDKPFVFYYGDDPFATLQLGLQLPAEDGSIQINTFPVDYAKMQLQSADDGGVKPFVTLSLHAGPAPAPFDVTEPGHAAHHIAYICDPQYPTQLQLDSPPAFTTAMK